MGVTTLPDFLKSSFDRGCEASIAEVAVLFNIPLTEHPFELCIAVQAEVEKYGIFLVPPLPKGSEESARLFCTPRVGLTCEELLLRIAAGESATSEFKSTMLCCLRTLQQNPNATKEELRSESVTHSILKTIAAFLNTSGGSLFVGIDDAGATTGLENDFALIAADAGIDEWELRFRDLVQTTFLEGKSVNNLIHVDFTVVNAMTVAHISTAQRKKVSYLKSKKGGGMFEVYVRQGNRTVSLSLPEFEEYLASR